MYTLITVLIIITCVLLILVVLVQNSKGGGLASGFSGSNQIMGVRKTADFLEKLTWGLAVGLVALCLFASFSLPKNNTQQSSSAIQEQIDNATLPAPGTQPALPTPPPENTVPEEKK